LIIKNYYCYNNSEDTVSHDGILKIIQERLDWTVLYTGNPYVIKPKNIFFMHIILMDSDYKLAMNLEEMYLVTENGNERLGKQKLDLIVL
tara:strand:- start:92 stop:361 length:270 start_codon:yes stop_codon:yes gene_type:complete